MRVRLGGGLARRVVAPHNKREEVIVKSESVKKTTLCSTIEGIPGSGATPRHPPTQAAKKCGIEPRLFPVPPAESPVDGAGPQRGRKAGPPDSYLGPLNPFRSPFFFGFQKPFFFQQGKRNGF